MDLALTDLAPRAGFAGAPERTDRAAQRRCALLASLRPAPSLQCVAAPLFVELPAPAVFGMVFHVSWPARTHSRLHAPGGGHGQPA